MLKTIGVLVIIAAIAGAVALYKGWLHIDRTDTGGSSNVTFGLDKDKVKRDLDWSVDKLEEEAKDLGARLDELKDRAKLATAQRKVELDILIGKLEREREELVAKLKELKAATGDRLQVLTSEVRDGIDSLRAKLDRAIDDLKS